MLQLRNKTYHLYRRVPKRFQAVEPKTFVTLSLKTDSKSKAQVKAAAAWEKIVAGWEARLAGDDPDAHRQFEAARNLAEARGFRYADLNEIAQGPLEDLVARLTAVRTRDGMIDQPAVPALLGGVPKPEITVSTALEMYWPLSADKLIGKSQDQIRRWRNPRIKAVKNFIQVVEDKPIHEISGDDMLDFREWLLERISLGEIRPESANKDFTHLGDVLKTVNKLKRLGLVLPLSDLSFKEGEAVTRPPFSDTWIKEKLLAPGALDGLNAEAAGILMAMVNTAARPSELAALTPECIHLTTKVPHISIEPIGRQLKTTNAR